MKPKVNPEECIGCGVCIDECKAAAIFFSENIVDIIEEDCTECGDCAELCVTGAITMD
jgi:NAD-dependent dihydropyrimidine dehydrogenase PreA subunit